MKVTITNAAIVSGVWYVDYSLPCGVGCGKWRHANAPEFKEYDVEMDIDRRIDSSALMTEVVSPRVERTLDGIDVCAQVDGIDDDGLVYLRLHPSCLVMVESDLSECHRGCSVRFAVKRDEVSITPFNGY